MIHAAAHEKNSQLAVLIDLQFLLRALWWVGYVELHRQTTVSDVTEPSLLQTLPASAYILCTADVTAV